MNVTHVRRVAAVIGLPAVVLFFGTIAYDATRSTTETRRRVERSHQAVEAAEAVMADLTEAESAERGFVLTGDTAYLPAYHAARARIPSDLNRLAILAGRTGPRTRALDTLRVLAGAKLAELQRGVTARSAGAAGTALSPLRNGEDQRIMRAVRASVTRLALAERAALARQSALEHERADRTVVILVVGTLVAGGLTFLVTMFLTREARALDAVVAERDRALASSERQAVQLKAQAEELERKGELLRTKSAELETIAETIPQMVWMATPDGVPEYLNSRWHEYTGMPRDQRVNPTWPDYLHPDDRARTIEAWRHSAETGEPFEMEYRFRRASDGVYRWFIGRAVPLRDSSGRIVRWFGTATDIDDAKRARENAALLAEAGAVLGSATDPEAAIAAAAGLVVPRLADWCTVDLATPDGGLRRLAVAHVDPAKVELGWRLSREYPPDPASGRGPAMVLRTGATEYMRDLPAELLAQAARSEEHLAMLRSLGITSYAAVPIKLDGEVIGVVTLVSADSGRRIEPDGVVTAEELAHRAAAAFGRARLYRETVAARDQLAAANATLRASETRLEIALEAGGFGWWEWDITEERVAWAPRLERNFGLRPGEFDGTISMFRSFVHPDDRDAVVDEVRRTLGGVSGALTAKFRIVRPDGDVRWIEAHAAVLREARGIPVRLLGVAGDVTAREAAEQERRLLTERAETARAEAEAARNEAERANAAKSEFLATMSHELRTPLNAIAGYAELMAMGIRGAVTDDQREDLARIRRAGRHLLSLINDILNYARLEAGSVEVRLDDVAIGEITTDIEAFIAPQVAAKGLRYDVQIPDPSLRVRADAEKVQQILVNLLTNAIKFTAAGGAVGITTEADGASVTLAISDTGRGIPADRLGQIFDPFVQVDRDLTSDGQHGVGLGLAISRDLARAMGGELTAESAVGTGSTFRLRLPRAVP